MRSVDERSGLPADGERAFFAAVNSGRGFVSFFEELFFGDDIKERYIIKGGPGTGKSSLMKRVALRARASGAEVELFYCSSDPTSLDGVIIDGRMAFIDGTAPHSYDTVLPGACDRIIDLGAFWNARVLMEKEREIRRLMEIKKQSYARAYGYLSSALTLRETTDKLLRSCVDEQKLYGAAGRCAEKLIATRDVGVLRSRQTLAHGIAGQVSLPTLGQMARLRHAVEDYYGTAHLFLRSLVSIALEKGCEVWVSGDTVDTQKPCQVLFPDTGELFYVADEGGGESEGDGRAVNMKRFVDASALSLVRREARTARGTYDLLLSLASYSLKDAGAAHASLEEIYVPTMDFSAQRTFCDALLDKLDI